MADQLRLFPEPQREATSDDRYTPKWIFDALGVTFDLDVAAPPGGGPFVPCRHYFTQKEDGLASKWEGLVWMNPPYSKTAPWIEKFIRHNNGIALAQFSKANWQKLLYDSDCLSVMPTPHLKFVTRDGREEGIFMPVVLWAAGDRAKTILRQADLGRPR